MNTFLHVLTPHIQLQVRVLGALSPICAGAWIAALLAASLACKYHGRDTWQFTCVVAPDFLHCASLLGQEVSRMLLQSRKSSFFF